MSITSTTAAVATIFIISVYFIWQFQSLETFVNNVASTPRKKEPSFPVVSGVGFATSGKNPAFLVKYLDSTGTIRDECVFEKMAKNIPEENVFPSSLRGNGNFVNTCSSQDAVSFRVWPF